jgi:hypothetical protein
MSNRATELYMAAMEYAITIVDMDHQSFHAIAAGRYAELLIEEIHEFITEEIGNDNGVPFLANVKTHFGVE